METRVYSYFASTFKIERSGKRFTPTLVASHPLSDTIARKITIDGRDIAIKILNEGQAGVKDIGPMRSPMIPLRTEQFDDILTIYDSPEGENFHFDLNMSSRAFSDGLILAISRTLQEDQP